MAKEKAHTIRDLAAASGLSIGAVSYALRDHPSVSEKTRKRVRELADELGYKPDPRLASLMAQIRRSQSPRAKEVIAWVWCCSEQASKADFSQLVYRGALQRAEQLGCSLESFWLTPNKMSPKRLQKILHTRGISGVLFAPEVERHKMSLDWDWSRFACAIVGMAEWEPALHRAGHDYYRSLWRCMNRMSEDGVRRPLFVVNRGMDERLHFLLTAGFSKLHPTPALAEKSILYCDGPLKTQLDEGTVLEQPDAILTTLRVNQDFVAWRQKAFPNVERTYTLHWDEDSLAPGICTCYDKIAGAGVDLVLAQLHRNERGTPETPTVVMLEGEWREAT
ncbi:LacI family DNA-binding transcriptional regulator [Cerasicoccus fimbriatus]|uniref:LacI family DNA-binding transcriptional regulator n=1 Tax=Cerasicoccus fimbriatus TaxID=3014554 RepID=UPI0022B4AEC5|nr:LacI family DNA-binding transcriptional regulator [Cerasicoccus sp. TK19100]